MKGHTPTAQRWCLRKSRIMNESAITSRMIGRITIEMTNKTIWEPEGIKVERGNAVKIIEVKGRIDMK